MIYGVADPQVPVATADRFVDSLSGRYVTAEDVGTTQADMDLIRRETASVTGVSRALGGSGDPSAATAYGVPHRLWGYDRVSFLVDRDGKVAKVWPDVDPAIHAREVLDAASRL